MIPAAVQFGQAAQLLQNRQAVLQQAYLQHPQRFVYGVPRPPSLPTAVWINPPKTESEHPTSAAEDRNYLH